MEFLHLWLSAWVHVEGVRFGSLGFCCCCCWGDKVKHGEGAQRGDVEGPKDKCAHFTISTQGELS